MKKRQPSPEKECPVCGQMCAARGLKSHMRLKHGIQLIERVVDVPDRQQVKEIVQGVLQRITPSVPVTLASNMNKEGTDQLAVPVQQNSPELEKWNKRCDQISAMIRHAIEDHGIDSPEHIEWRDNLIKHFHARPR